MKFSEFFGLLGVTLVWACVVWFMIGQYRRSLDSAKWLDLSEAERRRNLYLVRSDEAATEEE